MQYHRTPRPHWLLHGRPGRPLIVALHGFTQFVGDPSFWRPWNFAELSGLLELASDSGCSLCFPVGRWRNWGERDVSGILKLAAGLSAEVESPRVYVFGFSDGATLANSLAIRSPFSIAAAVVHSGLWPRWEPESIPVAGPPVLLVCGADDRTPVPRQQDEIKRRYLEAGRTVERWEISGVGHAWAKEWNGRMLAWCEGEASF